MSGRLGELLVRENLISVQQLRKAQEEQQKSGARIGSALIKTGAIEESKLTDFLSKQYGVPAINLKDFDIDPEIIKLVPKDVAQKHLVIPVNRAGPSLIVAITPTRGVDVASKALLLDSLAAVTRNHNAGLLLCSDELSDLVICDRVIVLVRGEIFTEFSEPPFDRDELIVATEGLSGTDDDAPEEAAQ